MLIPAWPPWKKCQRHIHRILSLLRRLRSGAHSFGNLSGLGLNVVSAPPLLDVCPMSMMM